MMNLYMKEKKDLSEIRKEVYHSVTEVCLGALLAKVEIDFIQRFEELDEEEQKWYRLYMDMYSSEIMEENQFLVQWRIRLHLNRDPLFHHSVSTLDVARKVEDSFRDLHAVASPTSIGIVDVFVDFNGIKMKKKKEEEKEEDNAKEIKCIHNVVLPYLKDIMICGMEGVTDVYMQQGAGRVGRRHERLEPLCGLCERGAGLYEVHVERHLGDLPDSRGGGDEELYHPGVLQGSGVERCVGRAETHRASGGLDDLPGQDQFGEPLRHQPTRSADGQGEFRGERPQLLHCGGERRDGSYGRERLDHGRQDGPVGNGLSWT
jgi:hypothetical protein